ncbi:MAG: ABC transporter permease subunit, partial [Candidatus Krumholzibacteria bacterium]|nr:ABC transporter permease subunit [Candidatus Krumholzibacteria bacterium]
MVWLTGAGLVVGLLMVVSLVSFVFLRGAITFWPEALLRAELTTDEVVQGEVTRVETFAPDASYLAGLNDTERARAEAELGRTDGVLRRRLVRIGNFELTGEHFKWVEDFRLAQGGEQYPPWLVVLERLSWGRFYGTPIAYLAGDEVLATGPGASWAAFRAHQHGEDAVAGHILRLETATGQQSDIAMSEIVRAYPGNQIGWGNKLGLYFSRWNEYLTAEPREANSEGGVFPAIFGTVVMTLGMTIMVVPFGVMAALYLREYAKQGWLTSVVRISINNLAGVPSIVFGVFGMGFFSYLVGGSIDAIFFADKLPNPTFGTGGIMWASLTLALLTLPVVIVATEEALAAVPSSMREGSFACGATKWQTIERVVLPRALPGIMTGAILA